jgi:DNA-binding IclR family transcriptional regulator
VVRTGSGESVLSRAIRIIEVFSPAEPALPVTEIARRTGLHVATTSRLITELVEHGLLERCPDRTVRIGVRMWELGWRASPRLGLRDAAMPFLEDLHAVVGQHAQLGVLDGGDVLFIERLSARDAVVNYSRIAGRLSLPHSSSGLVLLAHAPVEVQEDVLSRPLRPPTAAALSTSQQLRVALADVRRQQSAVLAGHQHPDATGVAVPVRDAEGDVVAALSVIVPNDGRAQSLVPALLAAARGITRAISDPAAPAAPPPG